MKKYYSYVIFFQTFICKIFIVDLKCDVYGEIFENGYGVALDDNKNVCYLCICFNDNNFNCKFYYKCEEINCTTTIEFSQSCCKNLKCKDKFDINQKVSYITEKTDPSEVLKWVSVLILIIITFICCIHKAGFIRFTPKSIPLPQNIHKKLRRSKVK